MGNCQNHKYSESQPSTEIQTDPEYPPAIHKGAILDISLFNKKIISASDDTTIGIFHPNFTNISHFHGHQKAVNRLIGGSSHIWSVSRDLSLKQWNNSGICVSTIENTHTLNVSAIAVQSDEQFCFTGSRDYFVKKWDVETRTKVIEYRVPRNIVTTLELPASHTCTVSDSMLFQGSEDLCVRVWDTRMQSTHPAMHLTGYVYFPLSMSLHSNGLSLATGCKGFNAVGCEVRVWDLRKTSSPLRDLKGHTHDVHDVKYLPPSLSSSLSSSLNSRLFLSGEILVSASKDGSIFVWDSCRGGEGESSASVPVLGSLQTGRHFTSLVVLEQGAEGEGGGQRKEVELALGAYDGSVSVYSLKAKEGDGDGGGGGGGSISIRLARCTSSYQDPLPS